MGVGSAGSGSQTGMTQPLWTRHTQSACQAQGCTQGSAAAHAAVQWPFSTLTPKTGKKKITLLGKELCTWVEDFFLLKNSKKEASVDSL